MCVRQALRIVKLQLMIECSNDTYRLTLHNRNIFWPNNLSIDHTILKSRTLKEETRSYAQIIAL